MKNILALDVSFNNLGWVVFERGNVIGYNCLTYTPDAKKRGIRKSDADSEGCAKHARALSQIITTNNIGGVVAEMPDSSGRSQRAAVCMAMAKAIVVTVCEAHSLPTEWVTPLQGKCAATGKKSASKQEVIEAMKDRFNLRDAVISEHVADAMAAYVAAMEGTMVRVLNTG